MIGVLLVLNYVTIAITMLFVGVFVGQKMASKPKKTDITPVVEQKVKEVPVPVEYDEEKAPEALKIFADKFREIILFDGENGSDN